MALQIPKYVGTAEIPPDAMSAPDAPMSDGPTPPQVGSIPPQAIVPPETFLNAVRENNVKRQDNKTSSAVEPAVAPTPEKKRDTVPNVFKKLGAEEAEPKEDAEDSGEVDSDVAADEVEFNDPLEAEPINVKPNKARSIKELRTQLKTTRNQKTQLENRIAEIEAENTRLKAYEADIEEHAQLKERVQHLESYQKIFDVYDNPEFQAKYVEGDKSARDQAKQIAQQYGIKDPAVIEKAASIRNRKDLNDFFKKQGLDELGISDIRPYIFHIQNLEDERKQLEKSPDQARKVLSALHKESEERRVATVSKTIEDRSNSAWTQIATYYERGDNALDLFKSKPGDPEHMERRKIVLSRANNEFQKVMGSLTGLGIKDLPLPIAHTLAARFQLSEVAGELAVQNTAMKQELADLKAQIKEQNSYSRPGFSQTSRTASSTPDELPKGTAVAEHVFNRARNLTNGQPSR